MTLRKIIQFVFCIVLFVGIVSAQNKTNRIIDGWKYEIPKTTIAPVIDGVQDPVWKTLDWNFQTSYDNSDPTSWDDWLDLFGAHKLMYDDDYVYCLFWTQDDDPVGNDADVNNYERNGVELYFDGDYSRDMSGNITFPDHHLTFRHEHIGDEANSDWDVEPAQNGLSIDTSDIEWKFVDDDNMIGYWFELKVPVDVIEIPNTAGSIIGLEFQQNDNDGNGREAISKWWLDDGDSSWQYAGTWGTGELTDRVVDDKFLIMKVPAGSAPVVDGELDDVYLAGTSATTNNFGNISIDSPVYPDDFSDAFFRCYLLYDDDYLYGFFDVYDDDPVGNDDAVNDYERNGVELYIDGDNSKDCSGTVSFPDHHITFRHEHIGNEANSDWDLEPAQNGVSIDTSDIEWKIMDFTKVVGQDDFEVIGYSVEFKIPIEVLDMPNTEGSIIGFELQQNDNDGSGRDVITKWWLNEGDSSWQYACTWGTAILGGEAVVGVNEKPAPIPTKFELSQNYPNPFNPSTKIAFSVAKAGLVTLKVFNLLGQEIATLVNEHLATNTYEVDFNAGNLPSGVYLYRVTTGNASITKKMMLLK